MGGSLEYRCHTPNVERQQRMKNVNSIWNIKSIGQWDKRDML